MMRLQKGICSGSVTAPVSKSMLHRHLIVSALSQTASMVYGGALCQDILSTCRCLQALGAEIALLPDGFLQVTPLLAHKTLPCTLNCGESGSTFRFLLPVSGAIGAEVHWQMEGRLSQRPEKAYFDALQAHGMELCPEEQGIVSRGRLQNGLFRLPGDVSSQFVSGLLMALPLLEGDSELQLLSPLQSAPYVTMTEQLLRDCGVAFEKQKACWLISGGQSFHAPQRVQTEGDWSGAAAFLCLGAVGDVTVSGLNADSLQGDRLILSLLKKLGARVEVCAQQVRVQRGSLRGITMDASAIPDLIPVLAALLAGAEGESRIEHAERLRYKESDRLSGLAQMLKALGGDVTETADGLVIRGKPALCGGPLPPLRDHRLAMAAAVAASFCKNAVMIEDEDCVNKSFPAFWREWAQLEERK